VGRSSSRVARRSPGADNRLLGGLRAFTLLELLCVVCVMAITAGSAAIIAVDTRDAAADDVSVARLAELRNAVIRFRQDTGHLPKSGPFALVDDGGRVATPIAGESWFLSPANLAQLFEQPRDAAGRAILPWDVDAHRGWRGPYMRPGPVLVEIGDGIADDGTGDPADGNTLSSVPALRDAHASAGPPVLLIGLESGMPVLISCGANGVYEHGVGDDRVLPILR